MGLPSEIITGLIGSSGYSGYQIDQSVLLDGSSDYFNITFAGDDGDTWTFSAWFKLDLVNDFSGIFGQAGRNDGLTWDNYNIKANDASVTRTTTRVFRDPGSWVHVYASNDGTRGRVFINGVEENSFNGAFNWTRINTAFNHYFCRNNLWGRLRGYCAEMHFCSLNEYEPTEFGEFYNGTTAWRPIEPSGLTYGNNGFYLDFSNPANLGEDSSGNGNNLTVNGSPVQSSDSPTKNYATLNVLAGNRSFSNGNRTWTATAVGVAPATMECSPNSGNWYAEINIDAVSSGAMVGVVDASFYYRSSNTRYPGDTGETDQLSLGYWHGNGNKYVNGINSAYGATYTTGDVIGILINTDDGEVTFYKNNISQGAISYDNTRGVMFACGYADNSGSGVQTIVFDENDWTYSAPSDAKALYAANLPDPTITDPGEYFNAVGYTGDGTAIGSGGQAITGVGFQSDFTWIKNRDNTNNHVLFDVLRGATNNIRSNTTEAEVAIAESLASFDADGFTVGSNGIVNSNTNDYISWNWKAGGAGVPNTDGTISSTVSVNDDAGFSIVSYIGTGSAGTVGHGLSDAPEMIIVKNRDQADEWAVYHSGIASDAETDYLVLNTTAAAVDNNNRWNDTAPTASLFSIGTSVVVNTNTENFIAYCFRSIPGYSKVFSFEGNGSANGPFVYLGFRPKFILYRNADQAGNGWPIWDDVRSPYNGRTKYFTANSNNAENDLATREIDFLSNGFKTRGTSTEVNRSGNTFVGIAFAENPFGGSNLPLALAR